MCVGRVSVTENPKQRKTNRSMTAVIRFFNATTKKFDHKVTQIGTFFGALGLPSGGGPWYSMARKQRIFAYDVVSYDVEVLTPIRFKQQPKAFKSDFEFKSTQIRQRVLSNYELTCRIRNINTLCMLMICPRKLTVQPNIDVRIYCHFLKLYFRKSTKRTRWTNLIINSLDTKFYHRSLKYHWAESTDPIRDWELHWHKFAVSNEALLHAKADDPMSPMWTVWAMNVITNLNKNTGVPDKIKHRLLAMSNSVLHKKIYAIGANRWPWYQKLGHPELEKHYTIRQMTGEELLVLSDDDSADNFDADELVTKFASLDLGIRVGIMRNVLYSHTNAFVRIKPIRFLLLKFLLDNLHLIDVCKERETSLIAILRVFHDHKSLQNVYIERFGGDPPTDSTIDPIDRAMFDSIVHTRPDWWNLIADADYKLPKPWTMITETCDVQVNTESKLCVVSREEIRPNEFIVKFAGCSHEISLRALIDWMLSSNDTRVRCPECNQDQTAPSMNIVDPGRMVHVRPELQIFWNKSCDPFDPLFAPPPLWAATGLEELFGLIEQP